MSVAAPGRTSSQAESLCNERGGTLAQIPSAAANDAIVAAMPASTIAWIGGQETEEGSWRWTSGGGTFPPTSGAIFNYSNWASGEILNAAGLQCAAIDSADGKWRALPCSEYRDYLICQRRRPASPSPPLPPPSPPPPLPPPPPPPSTATTAASPPATSPQVTSQYVLAGGLAAFDTDAFRASLQARFPSATSINVAVSAGSVVADVSMYFSTEASASDAADLIRSTDAATMSAEWFGGTVTVVNEPSSTVIVVVISPSEEVQTTAIALVSSGLPSLFCRCVVHCATHAQEQARGEAKAEGGERLKEKRQKRCANAARRRMISMSAASGLCDERACSTSWRPDERSLPSFQELQKRGGFLVEKTITRDGAFRASPKDEGILAVSHRWFNRAQPDKDGLQLHEIKEHLVKHEELKFVWFDYWCMPQGERTPAEDVAFLHMLKKINWLYLGCSVLVLLDLSYLSRFWTQFEAWLSFQMIVTEGPDAGSLSSSIKTEGPDAGSLSSSEERSEERCVIVPIYNANWIIADYLKAMWANKKPQQAHDLLANPDITVTNQGDKVQQLPKIQNLANEVYEVITGVAMEEGSVEAAAPASTAAISVREEPWLTLTSWRGEDAQLTAAERKLDAARKKQDMYAEQVKAYDEQLKAAQKGLVEMATEIDKAKRELQELQQAAGSSAPIRGVSWLSRRGEVPPSDGHDA